MCNETKVLDPIFNKRLESWEETYHLIKGYAIAKKMTNTLIALSVALRIHEGQKRDSGEPYIVHPLKVCELIINLGIANDILCAAAILHDSIEDSANNLAKDTFVKEYGLCEKVFEYVSILTKPKNYKETDPKQEHYFNGIKSTADTTILKLADRVDNMSTIDVFTKERMKKYVNETKELIYPLCKFGKSHYPHLSNAITIIKYRIVSICEAIDTLLGTKYENSNSNLAYRKPFTFVKGYSIGKDMKNTLKALYLAERLHEGDVKKTGDPFIIHPLRVCTYLISLNIDDDIICAAALLHEVLKKCDLKQGGHELITDYNISPEVLDTIKIMSNSSNLSKEDYYSSLKLNYKALLIKLSNRANTCTILQTLSDEEKIAYIDETNTFVNSLCRYGEAYYPDYSNQIAIMQNHINSICNIVYSFLKGENK